MTYFPESFSSNFGKDNADGSLSKYKMDMITPDFPAVRAYPNQQLSSLLNKLIPCWSLIADTLNLLSNNMVCPISSAAALLGFLTVAVYAQGGFYESCEPTTFQYNVIVTGNYWEHFQVTPYLSGECLAADGSYTNSTLDLNSCLMNSNGALQVRHVIPSIIKKSTWLTINTVERKVCFELLLHVDSPSD